VRRPTVPLGVRRDARWKRLTAQRGGAELGIGLDLEARLDERLLEREDVGPGVAGAQRAVAELGALGGRAGERRGRCDGGYEDDEDEYECTTGTANG
jgi:hypothetical protein